jgi:hypothetical protein
VKYLLLLYGDPEAEAALTDAERRAIVDEHMRFGRVLDERNAMVVGEALEGPAGTKTVRFAPDGGDAYVTDGPFLEAKESIGGFYVLSCGDMDEAVELAKQVPRSPGLVAELRPIAGS